MLGSFAETSLAGLDGAQLDRLEGLLDCADADLFDWITGPQQAAAGIRPRRDAPAALLPLPSEERLTMEHPLSPFMFPTWYRFQITSALSILHRLTGIALAVGSILLAWWLVAVAAGGQMFAAMHAFLASPIGVLLLFSGRSHSSTTCAAASGISPGMPATASRSGTPIEAATPCSPRRSS